MCGVPSFDLAFTYYSLLKCKAFSITERAIFAFCQRNCPSALVHGQLRRLFFFSRSDVDEMICVECRLLLSLLHTKLWLNAKRLAPRRGRCSLSFRIVGIEIQCMQCVRSKEKILSACVPLEYALGVCCLLMLLSMILRSRFLGYGEVRKSNIFVRFMLLRIRSLKPIAF